MNVTEFFISWTFVLLHFNKNCKQPNFKCLLLMTSQSLQPFVYSGCYMKFIIQNKLVSLIYSKQEDLGFLNILLSIAIHFDLRASFAKALE